MDTAQKTEEEKTEEEKKGALLRGEDREARRLAASLMGQARTPRKAASSAENGRLYGGKKIKPLAEIACACGAGDVTINADGKPLHPTTCPRGRVIRYRLTKGLPLT